MNLNELLKILFEMNKLYPDAEVKIRTHDGMYDESTAVVDIVEISCKLAYDENPAIIEICE